MNHAISSETRKTADNTNEAPVGDICQRNHLQNLSPACHKSKAPVYEHYVLIAFLHNPALNKSCGLS